MTYNPYPSDILDWLRRVKPESLSKKQRKKIRRRLRATISQSPEFAEWASILEKKYTNRSSLTVTIEHKGIAPHTVVSGNMGSATANAENVLAGDSTLLAQRPGNGEADPLKS